jgi:hypothetical protein
MAPEVRIGDREREQATALLTEHYAAGRLDTDEHAERLDAIWSARTRADLDQVFWDLPALAPPTAPVRATRPRRRFRLAPLLLALIVLAIVLQLPWWALGIIVWVLVAKGPACRGHRSHRHRPAGGPSALP